MEYILTYIRDPQYRSEISPPTSNGGKAKERPSEVEGIDDASVIIRHLSIGITAVTVLKPSVTNCLNLVHTKK